MKVVLINGSPHEKGCTYTALCAVASGLGRNEVSTKIFHIGKEKVRGCVDCGACREKNLGRCAFDDDIANRIVDEIETADGVVIGSPVYYAAPNGALCAALDRVFYSASRTKFTGKPAAAVVSCRRAGASTALDRLNKYFMASRMPVVSSQYWNMVHGKTPQEVHEDYEGMQTMRVLGAEMARMLKALSGVPLAKCEERVFTNFVR